MANAKDPITNQETVRLWFRRFDGLNVYAVKYVDPYGGQMAADPSKEGELAPIYVGMGGAEPMRLDELLQDYEQLKEFKSRLVWHDLIELPKRVDNLADRITNELVLLNTKKKHWWNRNG